MDMSNDIDFGRKPRNNKELRDILVEEFSQFTDKETYTYISIGMMKPITN